MLVNGKPKTKQNQNANNPKIWPAYGSPKYNQRIHGNPQQQGQSNNSNQQMFTDYVEHVSSDGTFFGSKDYEAVEDDSGIHKRTTFNHVRDGSGTFFDKPLGQVIDLCGICKKAGRSVDHLRENTFVCESCNARRCRDHSIRHTRFDTSGKEIVYHICTACTASSDKANLIVSCILVIFALYFVMQFLNATSY